MKRKLLYLSIVLFVSIKSKAQIVNPSFENWTNGAPIGWTTNNDSIFNVVQSTNSHTGSSAVSLKTTLIFGAILKSGNISLDNFSITSIPTQISVWLKGEIDGSILINSSIYDAADNELASLQGAKAATSVYQEALFNYVPPSQTGAAHHASINIKCLLNSSLSSDPNTTVYIDDVSLSNSTGLESSDNNISVIEKISPNPSQGQLIDLIYNLKATAKVKLIIFDVLGNELFTVFEENQPQGKFKAQIPTEGLSQGLYNAILLIDGKPIATKFVR
jgi:hypothetical protein